MKDGLLVENGSSWQQLMLFRFYLIPVFGAILNDSSNSNSVAPIKLERRANESQSKQENCQKEFQKRTANWSSTKELQTSAVKKLQKTGCKENFEAVVATRSWKRKVQKRVTKRNCRQELQTRVTKLGWKKELEREIAERSC